MGKYARKGDILEVSARYTERKYQDRDGNNRTAKEFVVDEVKILASRRSDGQEDAQDYYRSQGQISEARPYAGGGGYTGAGGECSEPEDGELPF